MRREWFIALCLLLQLAACTSTVTPDRIKAREASFDGNEQNSGIIDETAAGFVVTPHFRERYNQLIATYGDDFSPPLSADAGLTPTDNGHFLLTKEHMVKFLTMNLWRESRRLPLHPK